MAGAEPEPGNGGRSGSVPPGQSHSAVRVAPLDPEQLRRVLEQVTRAQPPPFVLQDAAQRLRDAAQQAALQRGPGARAPRLLPPQVRRRGGWRDRRSEPRSSPAQPRGDGAVTHLRARPSSGASSGLLRPVPLRAPSLP